MRKRQTWIKLGKCEAGYITGDCIRCGKSTRVEVQYPMSIEAFTQALEPINKAHEHCKPKSK